MPQRDPGVYREDIEYYVIYSVPAAHAAVPHLSSKWVIAGHSQGGLSSLGAAQLEADRNDPGYLGTVALAGAADLEDVIDSTLQARLPVLNGSLREQLAWITGRFNGEQATSNCH
jgi:pimeloyl-ACP methyl ester carboxylesterase